MSSIDRSGFRVLVVEDTPDQREIIAITLRPMEVITAVNGLDGLMKVDRVEPDFIISDIMMPEMDGWEFIKRVRQRPGHQSTPVIFLSALSSRDDMRRGYETGANVYLTKPYDPDRLIRNLEQFITESHLSPKPKRQTYEDLQNEEKRQASQPKITSRISTTEEAEDEDPFKVPSQAPQKLKAPAPPKPKAAEATKPQRAPKAKPKRQATRFLLVSTEPALVKELQSLLPQGHCEVVPAKESAMAMDLTALTKPDALILDWQLPDRAAQALAQLFSEAPSCRHRPLVVLSSKRYGMGDRRLLKNIGAYMALRRPVKREQFTELIGEINHFADREERAARPAWDEVMKMLSGESLEDATGDVWWEG